MMSVSESSGMLVFAHRGASGAAPENTLAAFQQAAEKGADGIELDVHLSADRKVVVIHDSTLERTSNGTGEVAYMNYPELARFDMSAKWRGSKWDFQRLPLLDEAIDIAMSSGMMMNIELKGWKASPALAEETAKVVAGRGFLENAIFSSFDIDQLRRLKVALPSSRRALLTYFPAQAAKGIAEDLWGCNPNHALTTASSVKKWHEAGKHILLWTVNTKEAITRAMRMGVDGIITNHPALAISIREGRIK